MHPIMVWSGWMLPACSCPDFSEDADGGNNMQRLPRQLSPPVSVLEVLVPPSPSPQWCQRYHGDLTQGPEALPMPSRGMRVGGCLYWYHFHSPPAPVANAATSTALISLSLPPRHLPQSWQPSVLCQTLPSHFLFFWLQYMVSQSNKNLFKDTFLKKVNISLWLSPSEMEP